ncbi:general vesicular transport factor p115 isoform X1 [Lampetra fluviatilis]
MNFLRGVMGGQAAGPQPTGAETVQKLCDRVASSTLIEDRRGAVRALKSLSKKYRMEVGTQGMEHLLHVLQTDRSDAEITAFALDTLCNIVSNDVGEEEEDAEEEQHHQQQQQKTAPEEDLGAQFTDVIIQKQENVSLLLSFLEEFEFHVRWAAVKLLTVLLKNRGPAVHQIILVTPTGVSRMMDLLVDTREVIRNDGLLLLQQLTKGNAAIQKIVAFENAFERLLDIVSEEGHSDGGIVVEDCLLLLQNLLKNNNSNQNFFKEGSYVQRMKPWFEVTEESAGWSAQKVTNLHLMLQLVRTLVSPANPAGAVAACQKSMFLCGLLQQLCAILMATGVPADILTETINTVSEVIRGCQTNQEYFAAVSAPSTPPRPALVVLLMSMVNERQPFVLRCAVLYCFQSFLYRNPGGQGQIVATLLPSTIDASAISAGQLLCGGLFSGDALSNWCAAVALAHALIGNAAQKEQLLRVQLATSLGNPPVSLLQQCTSILSQGNKVQTRVGLLILLCTWLTDCPIAVTHFLHNPANVPFLTGQISENLGEEEQLVQGLSALLIGICIFYNDNSLDSHTRPKLKQLVEKRIGKENFLEKLAAVSKHDLYSKASQKPQPAFPGPEQVFFDHEFTQMVREIEGSIVKAVQKSAEEDRKEEEVHKAMQQHDSVMAQYKELIREQDTQIGELKKQVASLGMQLEQAQATVSQQAAHVQQLKDQYNLLKVQAGKDGPQAAHVEVNGLGAAGADGDEAAEQLQRLRAELEEQRTRAAHALGLLAEREAQLSALKSGVAVSGASDHADAPSDQEVEALRSRVSAQEKELEQLKGERSDLQERLQAADARASAPGLALAPGDDDAASGGAAAKLEELEARAAALEQEHEQLQDTVRLLTEEKLALAECAVNTALLRQEVVRLNKEAGDTRKEQDDLLVLLADQDQKIIALKGRLRELGHAVENDEDEDDDDDEDDDISEGGDDEGAGADSPDE